MWGDGEEIKKISLDPLSLWLLLLITSGTFILMLPFSHKGEFSFIDALFTATSATCVTGLVVKSTGHFFTFWGQVVILILIQLGGVGILTFTSLLYIFQKEGLSLGDRSAALSSIGISDGVMGLIHGYGGIKDLLRKTVLFTIVMESIGLVSLFMVFHAGLNFWNAIYLSLFHSISAFCNAGFSLFDTSFIRWQGVAILNITMMLLIILGGIGFPVVMDIAGALKSGDKVSLHTKMVVIVTVVLIFLGALLFWLFNAGYFQRIHMPVSNRFWVSIFQSVTARTAGFNTIDMNLISAPSMFVLILLMFIGASPGSTGGGIKTTTLGVLLSCMWSVIRGRERSVFMGFSIPFYVVYRAVSIVFLFILLIISGTLILVFFEPYSLKKIVFEVVSATGTVGLSTGITPKLTPESKLVLIFLMFMGKVGPFTIAYKLFSRRHINRVEFPDGKVIVG